MVAPNQLNEALTPKDLELLKSNPWSEADQAKLDQILKDALEGAKRAPLNKLVREQKSIQNALYNKKNKKKSDANDKAIAALESQLASLQETIEAEKQVIAAGKSPVSEINLLPLFGAICREFKTALKVTQALLALNSITLNDNEYYLNRGGPLPILAKDIPLGDRDLFECGNMVRVEGPFNDNFQIKTTRWDHTSQKLSLMDRNDAARETTILELSLVRKSRDRELKPK